MISSICVDCGHRHRGINECPHCDCVWETIKLVEETMLKKLWKKIKGWFWK